MKRRDFLKLAGATMPVMGWMGGKLLSSGNAAEPVLSALPEEYLEEEFMDSGVVLEQFANLHNVKTAADTGVEVATLEDIFDIDWSKRLEAHLRDDLTVVRLEQALRPGDRLNLAYFKPETRIKRLQDCDPVMMDSLVTVNGYDIEHLQCRFAVPDREQELLSTLGVCKGWCEPCVRSLANELNAQTAIYASNINEWLPPPGCGVRGMNFNKGRVPVRVLMHYSMMHAATIVSFDVFAALVQTA